MSAPRRRRILPAAALLGVGLGLALLGGLRPHPTGRIADVPSKVYGERTARVHRPPPPLARRVEAPSSPPVASDEPVAELVDTGEASGRVSLWIDVVDDEGRPTEGASVQAVDCPDAKRLGPTEFSVMPGPCVARAVRRDGALIATGPRTTIDIEGPGPHYAQLELTSHRTGGIGVRFRPGPQGMRVVHVVEGSPAWQAGLEVGDRILEVDGVATDTLDSEGFVDHMTGPEGSEVAFVVGYRSDTGTTEEVVQVKRAFLDG